MSKEDQIPSGYTRDAELYRLYFAWHKDRYGKEPSSQMAIVCCDWARHVLENPPAEYLINWSRLRDEEINHPLT